MSSLPQGIVRRGEKSSESMLILALAEDSMVGLVEVRSYNHIALLFVDEEWHRRGVAKRLLDLAVERCKLNNSGLKMVEVHSSPFAVPVYERLEFVKTGDERVENGIRYTPMALRLE